MFRKIYLILFLLFAGISACYVFTGFLKNLNIYEGQGSLFGSKILGKYAKVLMGKAVLGEEDLETPEHPIEQTIESPDEL